MDKFRIEGGRRLEGRVTISGAKNAALPAMAAALLTDEAVRLENVPRVRDIITMSKLLAYMDARVEMPESRESPTRTKTFSPSSTMTIEAKWLGACKPDQKPGDIVMPVRPGML